MTTVKRYVHYVRDDGTDSEMVVDSPGDWISAADYDALAARLAEAERLLREVVDLPLWDAPVDGGEVGNRIEAFLQAADSASEPTCELHGLTPRDCTFCFSAGR